MSHLILHIGLHKTGTTSLQNLCFREANTLRNFGLIYPRYTSETHPQGVPGHHGLTLNLSRYFPQFAIKGGPDAAWDALVRDHARSDRTVLISSEEFSRGRKGFRVDVAKLGQIASAFDKVTVACVLREQVSFLQSVFVENSRRGRNITPQWLLGNAMRANDAAGLWADWRPLYDHLLTGFRADQLRFFDYHTLASRPGGIIAVILALAGIKPTSVNVKHRANTSPDPLAHLLCLPHFSPKPVPDEARAEVSKALDKAYGTGRPHLLFRKKEVAAIQSHFQTPNAELTAQIRRSQPDFAFSPFQPKAEPVYRDDVTHGFAENVLGLPPAQSAGDAR